jgi:hypothetical protein
MAIKMNKNVKWSATEFSSLVDYAHQHRNEDDPLKDYPTSRGADAVKSQLSTVRGLFIGDVLQYTNAFRSLNLSLE